MKDNKYQIQKAQVELADVETELKNRSHVFAAIDSVWNSYLNEVFTKVSDRNINLISWRTDSTYHNQYESLRSVLLSLLKYINETDSINVPIDLTKPENEYSIGNIIFDLEMWIDESKTFLNPFLYALNNYYNNLLSNRWEIENLFESEYFVSGIWPLMQSLYMLYKVPEPSLQLSDLLQLEKNWSIAYNKMMASNARYNTAKNAYNKLLSKEEQVAVKPVNAPISKCNSLF